MPTAEPPESLLRLETVKARCGISRSQIYALIAEGAFPAPFPVRGTRISVWRSSSIDRWIAEQIEEAA